MDKEYEDKGYEDMKAKTPYQRFFDLEKEMELFSLRYKGVHYWQLIRFGFLKEIATRNTIVAEDKTKRSLWKESTGAFSEAKKMETVLKEHPKVDIVRMRPCVMLSTSGEPDDHQYDYMEFEHPVKVMDLYALGDYGSVPACVQYSMAQAEKDVILWKIKRKILGEKPVDRGQKEVLSRFQDAVDAIYGISSDRADLERKIQYMVCCHIRYVERYIEIFRQVQPKIVMVYPHYDEHMFSAIDAAKRLGIQTIEIQHGRINSHEAYWYEDQTRIGKLLPDRLFTYGDWWNRQIHLPEFCRPVKVGNIYLESQVERFPPTCTDKMILAVFSNPQNGKELSRFVCQMDGRLCKRNVQILYKLHPNERKLWKAEYPWLLGLKNATIIDDGTSVYDILSRSQIVLGINSTVFFEATVYKKIKIVIYQKGDHQTMQPLLDHGLAYGVTTVNGFLAVLDGSEDDLGVVRKKDIDLWEDDAKKNVSDRVLEILGPSS